MLRFRRRPRSSNRVTPVGKIGGRRWVSAVAELLEASFIVLYGCMALLVLARLVVAGISPAQVAWVGDMVDFAAWRSSSFGAPRIMIPARVVGDPLTGPWAPAGRACQLDVVLMTRLGGAVTVLAVRRDGVLLSWAGAATSEGAGDCRRDKTILVSDDDYQRLVLARVGNPHH